jgi:hypothetical protein
MGMVLSDDDRGNNCFHPRLRWLAELVKYDKRTDGNSVIYRLICRQPSIHKLHVLYKKLTGKLGNDGVHIVADRSALILTLKYM